MPEVRAERTGWRDEWISLKHKQWGWDAPAADIDFLLCEYDYCQPKGIVEYKEKRADLRCSRANLKAVSNLGDMAGLPFFVVIYCRTDVSFKVHPWNDIAKQVLPVMQEMCEPEYVDFLYRIRGRRSPNQ